MTRALKLLLLPCALLALSAAPSQAAVSSTGPCWTVLLHDWADGHIDKVYPTPCYHQAIAHLPGDISTYSSARTDIEAALAQKLRSKQKTGETIPLTTTTTETLPNGSTTVATTTIASPGKKKQTGVVGAIDRLDPSSPNSFPLPLLILGALAVLLVLAGLGGMLYRRYGGGPAGPPAAP